MIFLKNATCSYKVYKVVGIKSSDNSTRFDAAKTRVLEELDTRDEADISRLQGVKCRLEAMRTNVQELVSLHEIVGKNRTDAEKSMINFACKKKDTDVTNTLDELKKNTYSVRLKLRQNKQIQEFMNSDDLAAHLQVASLIVDDDSSSFADGSVIDFTIDNCNLTDTLTSDESLHSLNSANCSVDSKTPLGTFQKMMPHSLSL